MAGTVNGWNNQIAGSYNQIILNAGTNGVAISTDASAATINVATGAAVKTTTLGSTNSTSVTTVACGTGGCNIGTSANAHATTVGSTTAASTTTIQAPSAGVILTGVQGVAVANKNYVTINTSTGALGSDAGAASSITITGDSGGGLTGSSFTFTGGSTGLTFAGAGSTETLGGTLIVGNGGTGRTTLTNHGVLVGATTSAITQLTAGTNGQVLLGSTSADPVFATLTSTLGSITYTTGAGTLNLDVANWVDLGTFTPVLSFGGASVGITYNTQTGFYSRIGNVVTYVIAINLSSKGSSTGNASISCQSFSLTDGQPFPVNYTSLTFVGNQVVAQWLGSSFRLLNCASAGSTAILTDTAFANGTTFTITGSGLIGG